MTVLQALAAVASRASLVGCIATALVLAPSFGHAAIQEHNWPARLVLAGLLFGVWCSFFGYCASRAHVRSA